MTSVHPGEATALIRHLYLHTPFCARICPYCAFHVHRGGANFQREFVAALVQEIRWVRDRYPLDLETVYFGGGTPSLLSTVMLEEICGALPGCTGEITMEVNPKTVTKVKAEAWKRLGFNRLSLGAQSFDAEFLKVLGRDHTPAEIVGAVERLREAGFTNLSIDLMFALPNQPRRVWLATLEQTLLCQPDHVSCYGLTYEEDTPFYKTLATGFWRQNEEDEIWMFTETERILDEAGLPFYEISNFARPGFESQHNRAYWLGRDYLGCGPSAFSTVNGQRWRNIPQTRNYIDFLAKGLSIQVEREELTQEVRWKERIMFGLRMREGVCSDRTELDPLKIEELVEEGLLTNLNRRLQLTSRGRLVADSIAAIFA